MSTATIDRMLKPTKDARYPAAKSATRPGATLRSSIGVRQEVRLPLPIRHPRRARPSKLREAPGVDRGGPFVRWHRTAEALPAADFRFSQDENDGTVHEMHVGSPKVSDWRPRFIDYLYVSTTNSTAFSPTDTILLSSRAC